MVAPARAWGQETPCGDHRKVCECHITTLRTGSQHPMACQLHADDFPERVESMRRVSPLTGGFCEVPAALGT